MKQQDILNYSLSEINEILIKDYGKGEFHGTELFRHLYRLGDLDLVSSSSFLPVPELVRCLRNDFYLPELSPFQILKEEGTLKFISRLEDEELIESVVIPMENHDTLCVSSQVGCRLGCRFCETGKRGFIRNLSCSEILVQYMTARFYLKRPIERIVFMGMGEPLDNFEAVMKSIDILTEPKGASFPLKHITVSTAGHKEGLNQLLSLTGTRKDKPFHTLTLAVSIHSGNNETRSELMPVNNSLSLRELKDILMRFPQASIKDRFYCEYTLIPGLNDDESSLDSLAEFLEGFIVKVNLIPYNPGREPIASVPTDSQLEHFSRGLDQRNIFCRIRKSKGSRIRAACGQLGQVL